MARLTGWRYKVFIGTFVGTIGLMVYSAMIGPMLNPEPYKRQRDLAMRSMPQSKSE